MFLAEALLVGTGRRSLPVLDIERHPAVFPFGTSVSVDILRAAKQFTAHRQGFDMEIVELATK